MTRAEYEAKAEELFALARSDPDSALRFEYENLAQSYLRLAQQVSETPPMASHQPRRKAGGGRLVPLSTVLALLMCLIKRSMMIWGRRVYLTVPLHGGVT